MQQKTFWSMRGGLLNLEKEINEWLAEMERRGYQVFSRDQIDCDNGGVYITYCLTQDDPGDPRVKLLERELKLMRLLFKHKEVLVDVIADHEKQGKPITFDGLIEAVRNG